MTITRVWTLSGGRQKVLCSGTRQQASTEELDAAIAALGLPFVAGQKYRPPSSAATGNIAPTLNSARFAPWIFLETVEFDQLEVDVTTPQAASFVRPMVYRDNGTGMGGTLVVDGGQLDASGTGAKAVAVSLTCTPGLYWFGAGTQGAAAATMRAIIASQLNVASQGATGGTAFAWIVTGISGAAPASFSLAVASNAASVPVITARVAT